MSKKKEIKITTKIYKVTPKVETVQVGLVEVVKMEEPKKVARLEIVCFGKEKELEDALGGGMPRVIVDKTEMAAYPMGPYSNELGLNGKIHVRFVKPADIAAWCKKNGYTLQTETMTMLTIKARL
jgi:hypothetical protein